MESPKKLQINNVPQYALNHDVWVIRTTKHDGLWFFGASDDPQRALQAISELNNGCLVHREWCEPVGQISNI